MKLKKETGESKCKVCHNSGIMNCIEHGPHPVQELQAERDALFAEVERLKGVIAGMEKKVYCTTPGGPRAK